MLLFTARWAGWEWAGGRLAVSPPFAHQRWRPAELAARTCGPVLGSSAARLQPAHARPTPGPPKPPPEPPPNHSAHQPNPPATRPTNPSHHQASTQATAQVAHLQVISAGGEVDARHGARVDHHLAACLKGIHVVEREEGAVFDVDGAHVLRPWRRGRGSGSGPGPGSGAQLKPQLGPVLGRSCPGASCLMIGLGRAARGPARCAMPRRGRSPDGLPLPGRGTSSTRTGSLSLNSMHSAMDVRPGAGQAGAAGGRQAGSRGERTSWPAAVQRGSELVRQRRGSSRARAAPCSRPPAHLWCTL
jgi:hypothetical protein